MGLQFTFSLGGRAVWTGTTTSTIVVAGNSSVSNIASNVEIVQSATIKGLRFSTSNNIVISRNNVTIAQLYGAAAWENVDFLDSPSSNIVITFNGNGTLHMELHKTSVSI